MQIILPLGSTSASLLSKCNRTEPPPGHPVHRKRQCSMRVLVSNIRRVHWVSMAPRKTQHFSFLFDTFAPHLDDAPHGPTIFAAEPQRAGTRGRPAYYRYSASGDNRSKRG